jgi:hypothetical protein
MFQRTWYLCGILTFGMLLAACVGPASNISTPAAQQPSTIVAATALAPSNVPADTRPPAPSNPAPSEAPALATPAPGSAAATGKPDYPGIWGIWGTGVSTEGRPWYKGQIVAVGWDEIELADNRFDWTKLDNDINCRLTF